MTQTYLRPVNGDVVLLVDATAGNETVRLPAGFATQRRFSVRRGDASVNTVTVTVPTGGSINGSTDATASISAHGEATYTALDANAWLSNGPASVSGTDITDASITAADLAPGSLTAADAAADLATQAELDAVAAAAVAKATLTTKGDIFAASAASTPARLPVGTTDGMAPLVKASASTGLEYGAVVRPDVASGGSTKVLASGGIGVGNSAAASTPGTCVKKIEVFDAAGSSLGYLAVYDAVTGP